MQRPVRCANQPGQLAEDIRTGAAEPLDDGVRRGREDGILSLRKQGQEFEDRGVGFLEVVRQDQPEAAAFPFQQAGMLQQQLACRSDDSGRVEGLGHPEVDHVAVLAIQPGRRNPVRPAVLCAQLLQLPCGAAVLGQPVEELADLLPEAAGRQSLLQVFRPAGPRAVAGTMAGQQFGDDLVLLGPGQQPGRALHQRQQSFHPCPSDQVESIGRPGPGRGGAQAAVEAPGQRVAQARGRQPVRGQEQQVRRVKSGFLHPAHREFHQSGRFSRTRAAEDQHRTAAGGQADDLRLVRTRKRGTGGPGFGPDQFQPG